MLKKGGKSKYGDLKQASENVEKRGKIKWGGCKLYLLDSMKVNLQFAEVES